MLNSADAIKSYIKTEYTSVIKNRTIVFLFKKKYVLLVMFCIFDNLG